MKVGSGYIAQIGWAAADDNRRRPAYQEALEEAQTCLKEGQRLRQEESRLKTQDDFEAVYEDPEEAR